MHNLRSLNQALTRRTEADLNEPEDASETKKKIEIVREWLKETQHLIARIDDQFIVTFLRRCCFDIDATKNRIEAFYTCKTIYGELFQDWAISKRVLEIVQAGFHLIPPDHLPLNGPRLFLTKLGNFDPKRHTFHDVFKVQFMLMELLAFEDDHAVICGVNLILDMEHCTVQHVVDFDPVVFKKMYNYLVDCIPLFLRRLYVINMRKELQAHFNHARNILPVELPFVVRVYDDEKDLYKCVPRFCMPAEYGGRNGSRSEIIQEWKTKLTDHEEYFERDAFYKSDERARRGRIDNNLQVDFSHERSIKKYGQE